MSWTSALTSYVRSFYTILDPALLMDVSDVRERSNMEVVIQCSKDQQASNFKACLRPLGHRFRPYYNIIKTMLKVVTPWHSMQALQKFLTFNYRRILRYTIRCKFPSQFLQIHTLKGQHYSAPCGKCLESSRINFVFFGRESVTDFLRK